MKVQPAIRRTRTPSVPELSNCDRRRPHPDPHPDPHCEPLHPPFHPPLPLLTIPPDEVPLRPSHLIAAQQEPPAKQSQRRILPRRRIHYLQPIPPPEIVKGLPTHILLRRRRPK